MTITNQQARPAQPALAMPVGYVNAAVPARLPAQRQAQRPAAGAYRPATYAAQTVRLVLRLPSCHSHAAMLMLNPVQATAAAYAQAMQAQQSRAQQTFLFDAERGDNIQAMAMPSSGMRTDPYTAAYVRPPRYVS